MSIEGILGSLFGNLSGLSNVYGGKQHLKYLKQMLEEINAGGDLLLLNCTFHLLHMRPPLAPFLLQSHCPFLAAS